MRRWMPLVLGLAACGGPNPETLLYELRVVAAVADPPEVGVGESYTLTATIADPLQEGGDWMIWSCIPQGDCVVQRGVLGVDIPQAVLPAVAPVPAWVMACAPGACDVVGATEAQLRDPEGWMQQLPLSGVTLGSRLTRITELPVDQRAGNPYLVEEPEVPDVGTNAEVPLSFVVPGAASAWGLATGGGFTMVRYDVSDAGEAQLRWVAPEEPGEVTLYVVFDDERGGTAVWEAVVSVGE
jgi:hypothetical protein